MCVYVCVCACLCVCASVQLCMCVFGVRHWHTHHHCEQFLEQPGRVAAGRICVCTCVRWGGIRRCPSLSLMLLTCTGSPPGRLHRSCMNELSAAQPEVSLTDTCSSRSMLADASTAGRGQAAWGACRGPSWASVSLMSWRCTDRAAAPVWGVCKHALLLVLDG